MATAEELKIRLTAQNDASRVVKALNADVARLAKTAKTSASVLVNSNSQMSAGFTGMGRSAGMAGMQVQQLVGQIQGGTNPMLALSQQAADLGFVLGAPLAGAVAGIGASIAMVLLPNLFASSDAAEDLSDDIEELTDKYKNATKAQKAFAESQAAARIAELKLSIFDMTEEMADLAYYLERDTKLVEQLGTTGSTAAIAASENLKKNNQEYLRLGAAVDTAAQKIKMLKGDVDFYNGSAKQSAEETKKLNEEFADLKLKLESQAATFGMTSTQVKRYEVLTSNYTKAQKESLLGLLDHIEAQEAQSELFKKQSEEITTLADGFDRYAESIGTVGAESGKVAESGMKKLEDNLVDVAMGAKSTADAFKDMARSIVADIMRIYIRQQLLGTIGNMGGGSGIGSIFSNGLNIGTAMEYGTNIGSQQTAMLAAQNLSFAGGGYTGKGSRSGGLDGKGGFMAMLHPNETVIDHSKGQGGGATVVNFNINAIDTQTGTQFLMANKGSIIGMIDQAYNRRGRRGING